MLLPFHVKQMIVDMWIKFVGKNVVPRGTKIEKARYVKDTCKYVSVI